MCIRNVMTNSIAIKCVQMSREIVYAVKYILYNIQFTVYIVHKTLYSLVYNLVYTKEVYAINKYNYGNKNKNPHRYIQI